MPFGRKRRPEVPDPGQRVSLLGPDGRWRDGFVAVSGPLSDDRYGVVVRVAEEGEYREARREGRRPVWMPWPLDRMRFGP
ncbi:hypothetical protein Rxycam_01555 [Rubrobacter xylanophilus DSM 9941]|uniref:hypothetical protein n=1 Tax=Rubrobacter xylanophilus TaxID=49319 RepID=UPI001C6407F9|nr:hypothetical protein [Rubrobacter xylanophilus]QYJ15727.1 hypothetical protein Rxycam_01555 [Rubrobacter xylanophilus DSM 9941]